MRPPIAEPRATEAIDGMIEMIDELLDAGHAYLTHGTVYFDVVDVRRASASCRTTPPSDMIKLAATRGGSPDDPHRRDPLDFVLWQPSLPDEPAWRAPFGVGRPGLARRVLGDGDPEPGPDARSARRRHRPDLPAPRVRDRAERERHRRAVLAPLDALGDGELRGREDEQVARQPRVRERPARRRPTRERSVSRSCGTTTAPASSGTTPTSTRGPRCSTASIAAARPRARRRPAPVRGAGARGARRRSRRAHARSRPSTTWRARSCRVATTRRHPAALRDLAALLGVDLETPV